MFLPFMINMKICEDQSCCRRAPCGHTVRRQFAQIKRIALGETSLLCETCHAAHEQAEAEARGWTLLGRDPDNDPSYRFYHHDGCGHKQRIARANMGSGRFICRGCDAGWSAEPSYVYAMSFTLENSRDLVKLGYSRDPDSRLFSQLRCNPEMPCAVIRKVLMPSGHAALVAEKRLHRELRQGYPNLVVDPETYHDQILVGSEIYDASLQPVIMAMLDEIGAAPERTAA